VWIHSGHGHNAGGIVVVEKEGGNYKAAALRAEDVDRSDPGYDLVFMNTCLSTDLVFTPDINPETGWDGVPAALSRHDVFDIGARLNAKSCAGWTCSVKREVSIHVPTLLMTALNTYAENGVLKQRTVQQAVYEIQRKMIAKGMLHNLYAPMLRCTRPAGTEPDDTLFDPGKKPN
jgi:hypothetical protein